MNNPLKTFLAIFLAFAAVIALGQVSGVSGFPFNPTFGTATVGTALVVEGTSDFQGNIASSTGTLTIDDALVVAGVSDFQGDLFNSLGLITIDDPLTVVGANIFQSTTDLQGNLFNSTGSVTIGDPLVVVGTTDLQGNVFNSTGVLTILDTVDISGSLTTGARVIIEGSGEGLINLHDTAAPADEKNWRVRSAGGNLQFQAWTDADAFGANAIIIDRTGTTIDSIKLTATNVEANGNAIWHAGNSFSKMVHCDFTEDPPSLAAGLSNVSTKTCTGATTGSLCLINRDASQTGLIVYCRVSATDAIVRTFANHTNSTVDQPSATYQVTVIKE